MTKRVGLMVACLALTAAIAVMWRPRIVPPQSDAGVSGEPGTFLEPVLPVPEEVPMEGVQAASPPPSHAPEKNCMVDLQVEDEDREPVANSHLTVFGRTRETMGGDVFERSMIPFLVNASGGVGHFEFAVPPGEYVASVGGAGSGLIECGSLEFTIGSGERSRNLVLPIHYRWIDGEALDAFGTPLPGAHVLFHQPDIDGKYPLTTASGPDGIFRIWCSTEFPALLKMNGKFDGLARSDPALPWTSEGISDVVTLPAGARHAVLRARTLDAGGWATFMVADDSGLARPWVEVIFDGNAELPPRRMRTGEDGCVRMDRLPRGAFEVSARFIGDDARSKVWILPDRVAAFGDGRTVLIRAQRGIPARGKVVGPDGQPLFGADIRRIGDGGSPRPHAESAEDGSFTLLFPPEAAKPLRFQVTYEPAGAGNNPPPGNAWIGCIVEIAPRDSGIEIVLSPAEESPTSETAR